MSRTPGTDNDDVFNPRPFDVIAANHGEDSPCFGLVVHHAVGHQRFVNRESVTVAPRDAGNGRMESSRAAVPDRDAVAHGEAVRVGHRDLLLAEVAVQSQERYGTVGLSQDRFAFAAPDSNIRSQVQRIIHQVFARPDRNGSASESGDIIDRRLQRPVVTTYQLGILSANRYERQFLHRRVHCLGQLLLIRLGRGIGRGLRRLRYAGRANNERDNK